MPVAAFPPPSSDAAVESPSAAGPAVPRSQMPATPEAGSTFDQFLPKAKKALLAGDTAGSGGNSGQSKPGWGGSISRRSRDRASPADSTVVPAADPIPAPASAPLAADPSALDLSVAQPGGFTPPVDPAPPLTEDADGGEPSTPAVAVTRSATAPLPRGADAPSPSALATGVGDPSAMAPQGGFTPPAAAPAVQAVQAAPVAPTVSAAPAPVSAPAPAALPSSAVASLAEAAVTPAPVPSVGRPPDRPTRTARAPEPAGKAKPAAAPDTSEAPAGNNPISEFRIQSTPSSSMNDGEKNAAPLPPASPAMAKSMDADEKKSLLIVNQPDKLTMTSVGIDAAPAGPAMTPDYSTVARSAPLPSISAPAGAAAPAAAPAQASARVAVDAVVKLLDVQTGRSQEPVSAVSLNFKFGGDDLAVRVEWRNGEVHTQFRTDSPELRSALASQWQATAPNTGNRTTPFAAPVFSSSGDPSASASRDEREARQPGDEGYSGQPGGSRTPRPKAPAPSASLAASVPLRTLPISTTLRLHTFA